MALFRKRKRTVGKPGEWYYCLGHHKVEEGPDCPGPDRLGPYPSPEAAAHAFEIAEERNKEWDEDPNWQQGKPGGGEQ
ncbi:hypothetical protein HUT18_06710 [Streptomyces sp. NA04227]|uniref:hypothetical protein n=1 Tax=Streptomyces sp. NA04227 TaxID=2742136 RepID=UPI00159172F3|nr:hypothetical protein [Streptomyces sp. NA04227]QKW06140.1 hypothetical protein HUT18_06710 [Streptomyces sp. NA04227]